mgnify:CR=1 FL=1
MEFACPCGRSDALLDIGIDFAWCQSRFRLLPKPVRKGAFSMSLASATVNSVNTVYAQLILVVCPKAVRETAKMMGIKTKLDGLPDYCEVSRRARAR